ncbi:unknown [Acetobacter sp. CAG:977]|nr:unknown [Acetobacter sp. CAG:977]
MAGNAVRANTDFHTTAMSAINVQVRGFRNDDDFGRRIKDFFFHDDVPAQTVAIFFLNRSGYPQGIIVFQSQIFNDFTGINHGCHTAFLVGSAASVNDTVFQFAFIRIARPQLRICNADGVNVGVHGDNVFSVSDAAENIAHLVDADFVKADFFHFLFDALDDFFFMAAF